MAKGGTLRDGKSRHRSAFAGVACEEVGCTVGEAFEKDWEEEGFAIVQLKKK